MKIIRVELMGKETKKYLKNARRFLYYDDDNFIEKLIYIL